MQPRNKVRKEKRPGRPNAGSVKGSEALLQAAQTIFAIYGYEGASLRRISQAAGVNVALASHHFGSKEGLWEAVIERLRLAIAPYLEELLALHGQTAVPIRVRLEIALRHFIEVLCNEPNGGMLLARVNADRGEKLDSVVEKLLRPYRDAFEPLLKEAMLSKLIPEQPVRMLYYLLFHSLIMTISFRHTLSRYDDKTMEDLDVLKREMTTTVMIHFFPNDPVLIEPCPEELRLITS